MSVLLGSFPAEYGRHGPDDASDPGPALPQSPALPDQIRQAVEDQQDAVVGLGRRHLEEAAALRQCQQPALLARDPPVVPQVPLVAHDDDWDGRRLPAAAADQLQQLEDAGEAAAVADVVDKNHPVGPLQLLVTDGAELLLCLEKKHRFTSVRDRAGEPSH